MNLEEKRGKAVLETVVIVLLIILAAVAIIVFLVRLQSSNLTEDEACANSIKLRSIGANVPFVGSKLFPLNCKTKEIEITSKNKGEIKEQIVDGLYDDWYKLGEGQASFLSTKTFAQAYNQGVPWKELLTIAVSSSPAGAPLTILAPVMAPLVKFFVDNNPIDVASCAIASADFVAEDLKNENITIDDFYTYILKEKPEGKDYTYYQYFTHQYKKEKNSRQYEVYALSDVPLKDYLVVFYTFEESGTYWIFKNSILQWSFGEKYSKFHLYEAMFPEIALYLRTERLKSIYSGIPFAILDAEDLSADYLNFKGKRHAMMLVPMENQELLNTCYDLQSLT